MQRRHISECNTLLVIHAAPRDSAQASHGCAALEWNAAGAQAGPVPGEEPVVEPAVQAARPAKLSAQCVC